MKSAADKLAELRAKKAEEKAQQDARNAEIAAEEKALSEARCIEIAKIFDLCGAAEMPNEAVAGAARILVETSESAPAEFARITEKGATFLPRSLLSRECKSRPVRRAEGSPSSQSADVVAASPDAATTRQEHAAEGSNV